MLSLFLLNFLSCIFYFKIFIFKRNVKFVLAEFQTKMAGEIQIHVDPMEEEEAFLRAYSDTTFPPLGMTCPVRSCPDPQLFTGYGEYLKHYISFSLRMQFL